MEKDRKRGMTGEVEVDQAEMDMRDLLERLC